MSQKKKVWVKKRSEVPPRPYASSHQSEKALMSGSKRVKVTLSEIKKEMEKEAMKRAGFADQGFTESMNNVNQTDLIATVPLGSSINSRVGAVIKWKSIQIRGAITSGAGGGSYQVALILVYDRKPRGAQPLVTDVLNSASPIALLNDANRMRFVILKRWDFLIGGKPIGDGDPANSFGPSAVFLDEYVKLKGLKCVYNGIDQTGPPIIGDGGIGDITEGALHVLTLSTSSVVGANAPQLNAYFRTRFADIQG